MQTEVQAAEKISEALSTIVVKPPANNPTTTKRTPKVTKDFLLGATLDERVACVSLIRLMRVAVDQSYSYWLSHFVQWLLHLDAASPNVQISIEEVEACLSDMKELRGWHRWVAAASKRTFLKDHPAFTWLYEEQASENLTAFERHLKSNRDESNRLRDMFLAPDPRTSGKEGRSK